MKSARILDHNIEQLLRRAYVPALPLPEFRERLEAVWMKELARKNAPAPPETSPAERRWPWAVVAAAAAVLIFLVGTWMRSAPPTTAEAWLARGEAAYRDTPSGPWTSVGGATLPYEAGHLAIATPLATEVAVGGADWSLRLAEASRVELELRSGTLDVDLHGSLDLAHRGAGVGTLATEHGTLELRAAELRLRQGPQELTVTVEQGEAWYSDPSGREPLPLGKALSLTDGHAAGTLAESATGATPPEAIPGRREPVVSRSTLPAPPLEAEPEPQARIEVTVRDKATGTPIEAFAIALLEERIGNEFRAPAMRAVEAPGGRYLWLGDERARQEVFVHAPGYALARSELIDPRTEASLEFELEPGTTLRGIVLDEETGNPVPGAQVLSEIDAPTHALSFDPSQMPGLWLPVSTRSALDGSFELEDLSVGKQVLRISSPDHAPIWIEREARPLSEDRSVAPFTVSLRPGGSLEGFAFRDDGAPFADAYVIVSVMENRGLVQMNFAQARTDDQGYYRIDHLPLGNLLAIFLGDATGSAAPRVRPVGVRNRETTRQDFGTKARGARLFGRLIDARGEAVPHQNLGLFRRSSDPLEMERSWEATTTDARGRYLFDKVVPGTYHLFTVDQSGGSLQSVGQLEVPENWPEIEHDVVIPGGRIPGLVLRGLGSEPLPNALAILEEVAEDLEDPLFAGMRSADEEGRFTFEGVPPGRYYVTVYSPVADLGFESLEVEVTERAAETVEFRLYPGASLAIQTTDVEGRPVQGAFILLRDPEDRAFSFNETGQSDEQGRYLARGVRPGRYHVEVRTHDFRFERLAVECPVGSNQELNITLSRVPTPGDEGSEHPR